MALRSDGARTKKRILSTCVRLFIAQGYRKTTMRQICEEAQVSVSSFQHLFGNKDGVLVDLMKFMYDNQFAIAENGQAMELPPVYVYAMETSIQLAIADLNENIRECYLEAYTYPESMEYIQRRTAGRLHQIFGAYQPQLTVDDFYVLDFGSAGMMRGYMANPVTEAVPLERKVQSFLMQALRAYKVPEEQVEQVLAFVDGIDIRSQALQVMKLLFQKLSMHFDVPIGEMQLGA